MNFEGPPSGWIYDLDAETLLCDNPDVFVRWYPANHRYDETMKFTLHYGGKVIGFTSHLSFEEMDDAQPVRDPVTQLRPFNVGYLGIRVVSGPRGPYGEDPYAFVRITRAEAVQVDDPVEKTWVLRCIQAALLKFPKYPIRMPGPEKPTFGGMDVTFSADLTAGTDFKST